MNEHIMYWDTMQFHVDAIADSLTRGLWVDNEFASFLNAHYAKSVDYWDIVDIENTYSGEGEFLGSRICFSLADFDIHIDTRYSMIEAFCDGDVFVAYYENRSDLHDCCRENALKHYPDLPHLKCHEEEYDEDEDGL